MQATSKPISLDVTPPTGTSGSTTLVLTNRSEEPVGYNLCPSALERRSGAGWEPVPSNRICTMELRTLKPGERIEYAIRLPATAAGEYRYRTHVEWFKSGTRSSVASQPFHVH